MKNEVQEHASLHRAPHGFSNHFALALVKFL